MMMVLVILLLAACGTNPSQDQTSRESESAAAATEKGSETAPASSAQEKTAEVLTRFEELATAENGKTVWLSEARIAEEQDRFDKDRMLWYFRNPEYTEPGQINLSLILYDGIWQDGANISDTNNGAALDKAEREKCYEGQQAILSLYKFTGEQISEMLKKYTGLELSAFADRDLPFLTYRAEYDAYYLIKGNARGGGGTFTEGYYVYEKDAAEPSKLVLHWESGRSLDPVTHKNQFKEGALTLRRDGANWLFDANEYFAGAPAWSHH